jgi:hypothetical protein
VVESGASRTSLPIGGGTYTACDQNGLSGSRRGAYVTVRDGGWATPIDCAGRYSALSQAWGHASEGSGHVDAPEPRSSRPTRPTQRGHRRRRSPGAHTRSQPRSSHVASGEQTHVPPPRTRTSPPAATAPAAATARRSGRTAPSPLRTVGTFDAHAVHSRQPPMNRNACRVAILSRAARVASGFFIPADPTTDSRRGSPISSG